MAARLPRTRAILEPARVLPGPEYRRVLGCPAGCRALLLALAHLRLRPRHVFSALAPHPRDAEFRVGILAAHARLSMPADRIRRRSDAPLVRIRAHRAS